MRNSMSTFQGRRWQVAENPVRFATQVASHAQKYFARLHGTTKRKSRFTSLEEKATVTFPAPSPDAFPSLPQPQLCSFPAGALILISAEQRTCWLLSESLARHLGCYVPLWSSQAFRCYLLSGSYVRPAVPHKFLALAHAHKPCLSSLPHHHKRTSVS